MVEATTKRKPAPRALKGAKKAPVATKAPETKVAPKKAPKQDSSAYAVLATGGKQYLVRPGMKLRIEKLPGEFAEGDTITFDNVLASGDDSKSIFGTPFIKDASVSGTLLSIGRAKKVIVIKYKQKSRYFKKNGHRQPYFEVRIDSIK